MTAEFYLFPRKDVLVEVKLDLLVGNVDAELLKGVLLEVFKTKDVQDADVEALVILSGEDESKALQHSLHCALFDLLETFIPLVCNH